MSARSVTFNDARKHKHTLLHTNTNTTHGNINVHSYIKHKHYAWKHKRTALHTNTNTTHGNINVQSYIQTQTLHMET